MSKRFAPAEPFLIGLFSLVSFQGDILDMTTTLCAVSRNYVGGQMNLRKLNSKKKSVRQNYTSFIPLETTLWTHLLYCPY